MNPQQRKVVHECGLFAGIGPEQADAMLSCLNARQEHYAKNTVVWNIGDTLHACALVLSGCLRAESVNASGEHLLMANHRAGALVGDVLWAQRQRTLYLSAKSLRQRISMRLYDEYRRTGSLTFSLGGTREDLADFLGANRSALSREIARMKEEGILDYYKDTFRILSLEKLTKDVG